jgi:predicted nuclease of predicted toxin-antitoxin system
MQIRLYVDEDAMARAVVQGLRARGIDVITVLEAGMSEEDDEEQLRYATVHGRVLYTFNVGDFFRLHSEYLDQGKSHAGIILTYRQRYPIGEQIRRLLRLINTKSAEEMRNTIHFL